MNIFVKAASLAGLSFLFSSSIFSQYVSQLPTGPQTSSSSKLLGCTNWLSTLLPGSKVTLGDLDVSGNQLTVEAFINRTGPLANAVSYGHVVSKHTTPTDVNYALLPNGCELTTDQAGYHNITVCYPEFNKAYHIAMVYNGTTLRFYRDGYLMGETPCTGNMINNNWLTTISQIADGANPSISQFLGYVNEVRIWNVARTQAEIQAYMNTSLPTPALQTGLLAYYIFDNLTNKQGNPAWNGTLLNGSAVNQTNPNCEFSRDSCGVCYNWLGLPTQGSKVTIGDLDITGNKLTIEAVFNRTQPLNSGSFYGSLVSKHTDALNACYSLLPNGCEITTTVSHYKAIFQDCPIDLNKTYHVAMVYDGTNLKFYRNGLLLSYIACTGNIVNNDLIATIGQIASGTGSFNNQFLGYINEVRIWNVARTQAEINSYMNTSLPSPTTQTGLKGYYTFTDLLNKQGNTAWDGTPEGGTIVDVTNPSCGLAASSCPVVASPPPGELIINDYTPVVSLDQCKNAINVDNAGSFRVGDTVLLIQMQGAAITETNSAAFGDVSDYRDAGNYEYNYIKSKSGNQVELLNKITRNYDISAGKVQLIRVPYYQDFTNTAVLTCLPWDGAKGGVLVFNVANTLDLQHNIDVTGRGFLGGKGMNTGSLVTYCFENNYSYDAASILAASKGQSIAILNSGISLGKGAAAGGGGGGNDHNSGGGGGGNGGAGGFGGYQYEICGGAPFDNRGVGGKILLYDNAQRKIFMGGGGGAGHANNTENANNPSSGGNGGGIVIISAQSLVTHTNKIIANGDNAPSYAPTASSNAHEAMGGGGSGGTVLLNIPTIMDNTALEMKGGKGGDMTAVTSIYGRIGPGGGGGGGVLWTSQTAVSPLIVLDASGGAQGVLTQDANNPWGTTPGQNGASFVNLALPIDNTPFKPNIDSVRIRNINVSCTSIDFKGLAYTNTSAIAQWDWAFGDGNMANTQDILHDYINWGQYDVKLIATDVNGCKDSMSVVVETAGGSSEFTYQVDICNPLTLTLFGTGTPNANTYWNFGDGDMIKGVVNTTHAYDASGSYTVSYSEANPVCADTVRKLIHIDLAFDNIILTSDTTICYGSTKQLRTVPSTRFCWSPITYLDDPDSPQPVTSTPQDITYYFTAEIAGTNLVTNGDFSQGNNSFSTQYANSPTDANGNGVYFIQSNPSTWYGALPACVDHTSGNGNMMMVDGFTSNGIVVWGQTVTVSPNTNYTFSFWMQSLSTINTARLRLLINGQPAGVIMNGPSQTCEWKQFFVSWNAAANTTAELDIINDNLQQLDNLFALDDIAFAPVLIRRDSVLITVEKPAVTATNDTLICAGTPVQLNAAGAQEYTWLPGTALTDAQAPNPIANPMGTTQYIVTGITAAGCVAKDTVNINVFALPTISLTKDTMICRNTTIQLLAGGGLTYAWSPASSLDDAGIPNPIASPVVNTTYVVTLTDQNSCRFLDSVDVSIRPDAVFSINSPQEICLNTTYHLQASGGDQYTWEPSPTLNDPGMADPTAAPLATTDYTVTIEELQCHQSATLSTRITVLPLPLIEAFKSNDIDCSYADSRLSARGGGSFAWTPAATLSNPRAVNPVATPVVTTTYVVTGTDSKGCTNTDSVIVKVENTNKGGYEMPNAFSPNNDGLNDCYGIKYWGMISHLEFSVYNRWGERIFYTADPGRCWDGMYRGVKQDPGVYVYMVKASTFCEAPVFRKGTFVLIR